eukprot:4535822-Amphidinium_carterae.1
MAQGLVGTMLARLAYRYEAAQSDRTTFGGMLLVLSAATFIHNRAGVDICLQAGQDAGSLHRFDTVDTHTGSWDKPQTDNLIEAVLCALPRGAIPCWNKMSHPQTISPTVLLCFGRGSTLCALSEV